MGPPDGHAGPLMNSLISAVIRQDRDFVNDGKHKANEGMGEGSLRVPHCSTPLPACWQQAARGGGGSRNPPIYPPVKRQGSTPYWGKTEEGSTCGLSPKAVEHNPQGQFRSPLCYGSGHPSLWQQGPFSGRRGKGLGCGCQGRQSPWHQARGDPPTLQPSSALAAPTCSIPPSRGFRGSQGFHCAPSQCTHMARAHIRIYSQHIRTHLSKMVRQL